MRISDWSSDVCSSDLHRAGLEAHAGPLGPVRRDDHRGALHQQPAHAAQRRGAAASARSEEHTSELQSLMRISYAVFCLKKKNKYHKITSINTKHCWQHSIQNVPR